MYVLENFKITIIEQTILVVKQTQGGASHILRSRTNSDWDPESYTPATHIVNNIIEHFCHGRRMRQSMYVDDARITTCPSLLPLPILAIQNIDRNCDTE